MCVRLVQMNGVDLKTFQFDYDQTWCVFFLNTDGTIYGRYGTRADRGNQSMTHISIASLKKSMERALKLHADYPVNKAQLVGKLGREPAYRYAQKIPGLQDKPERATPEKHNSCIHCHMVQANARRSKWQEGRLEYEDIWIWPLPENIGLKMDVDDGLLVKSVATRSPAAQAGIRTGDELVALNGQRLLSQADIQWVLHNAPVETQLVVSLIRAGETVEQTIMLRGDWKESDLSWRASSGIGLRHGFQTEPLSNKQKQERGIAADALALRVRNFFLNAGRLRESGVLVGDVIVEVDGKSDFANESQFLAYLRLNHPPGDRLKLTLLRGQDRHDVEVTAW